MSDVPVVFKRTKPKPNQRARVSTPDPDATLASGGNAEAQESPIAIATKLKKKTRSKAKTTLSFGGEEEGEEETFKLKKSALSRRITLGQASTGAASLETSISTRPMGPTYDAAYLSELKASTPSARPPLPSDSYDADISMNVDSVAQLSALSNIADESAEMNIPSASSIAAAKQKRERLRSTKGGEDYISLSLTKRDDYSQGPHPESRLTREEDELGDADDEFAEYTSAQERIALGKKSRKKEALKRRVEMNEMIVDAEEEDEETKEWEQEQLRRGGLRAESIEPAAKPVYKPAPIPPVTPIPTMGAAVARLTQSMSELTTSHAQHSTALSKLGEEQRVLEEREKEMREMIAKAEEKRSWFSAFREWVESVATFLDEKFPPLEKLEDEHISIMKERAEMIARRRKAEDEDDLRLFLGTPSSLQPQADEVDELGRAIPSANSPTSRASRTAAREARRLHRRAANQQRGRAQREDEGYSTDSELLPSDADDYRVAMGRLLMDAKDIMADVKAEEFKDPNAGLAKWFGEWRVKFADVYTGAWGGLGMVGAWEFWVRLEMVGWNPLERPRSLDSFSWYKSLYKYSRPSEDDEEESELGPDGDLVSAMITTAVIPRFCRVIEGGSLDPYSATDVRRLIELSEEIEVSVDKQNLKFELLLKSVYSIFGGAVTDTETTLAPFVELNQPPRFDPSAIPARKRFLTRRYKLLRNLLQWRKHAGDRYGLGNLATRLVSSIMLPAAEGGWEVGGEEIMRKVAQALPTELVPPSLQSMR